MFDGNAEEAINFYRTALKAEEPAIMRYSDAQGMDIPDNYSNKVMHAELRFGDNNILYFSDNYPDVKTAYSNGITFNIAANSEAELRELFNALSTGGKIVQPVEEQFWGAIFGSLDDKYGIHWSLNYDLPQD